MIVEVGGLARSDAEAFQAEFGRPEQQLRRAAGEQASTMAGPGR